MQIGDQFLKVAEARNLLRIGQSNIYGLLADGTLKHHRIGRSIRISVDDIKAYLRSTRQ